MPPFSQSYKMPLQSRVLLYIALLLMGTVVLIMTVVDVRNSQMYEDLSLKRGLAIANSIEAASARELLSYNYVALQQLADRATQESGVIYVAILDKEGAVAGFSGRSEWQGRVLSDSISTVAVNSRDVMVQEMTDPLLTSDPGLDISVPVFVEGSPQKWGTVRVGLSLAEVYAQQWKTRWAVIGMGCFVLLLGVLGARLLTRRITGPLGHLVEATDRLSRGQDLQVSISTGDEIEHLAQRFNDMAREVRRHQVDVESKNLELASLNSTLEMKVEERTKALMETEEKYRILVDHSPNPICIFRNKELVFYNEATLETFGYTAMELGSPTFRTSQLIHAGRREVFDAIFDRPVETNGSELQRVEIVGTHKNGQEIHLDMQYTWITYEGEPAVEAILTNVTERNALQDKAVAGERLRALGEMASGVAHDFNNVLGTILARAQYLQLKTESTEVRKGLRVIEKAAEDGANTVKRIQDFSRVRKDRCFVRLNVDKVLDDVIEMTRTAWEAEAQRVGKQITMVRDFQATHDTDGNLHEMREVFTNLILNAMDAIEERGTISVKTRDASGGILVVIEDDGQGMTEEVRRKMFDPFFTTKGINGNGLGMSIVYGILSRHGATIDVMSKVGEGTQMKVQLSASVEEGGSVNHSSSSIFDPGLFQGDTSARILVVDDEEGIRSLVQDILADAGYEVVAASGGKEAVQRAGEEAFDMVITDLGMPEMNGWEVSREIRKLNADTLIVLLTGWGAALDEDRVKDHDIATILEKPFTVQSLLETVGEMLADRRKTA